jgi:hypothetical protein
MQDALLALDRRGVDPLSGKELLATPEQGLDTPGESALEKILNHKVDILRTGRRISAAKLEA